MGRIRTIKPEFPQSESMGSVSRDARLCFIMLWTFADDEGRLRANPMMLANILFPYDTDAKDLIDGWLEELHRVKSIIRYEVDGNKFIQICKWSSHQKIDRATKSKIPAFDESSTTARLQLDEHSTSPRRAFDESSSQEGNVSRKVSGNGVDLNTTVESASQTQPDGSKSIRLHVFEFWKQVTGHKQSKYNDKLDKLIKARMGEGFTVSDLEQAINGMWKTPHNRGDNDRKTVYDGLDLICRDGANVNRFMQNFETLPPYRPRIEGLSDAGQATANSVEDWLNSMNEQTIEQMDGQPVESDQEGTVIEGQFSQFREFPDGESEDIDPF